MALEAIRMYDLIPVIQYESNPESEAVVEAHKTWWGTHAEKASEHGCQTVSLLAGKARFYSVELLTLGTEKADDRSEGLKQEYEALHTNYQTLLSFATSIKTAGEYVTRLLDEEKLRTVNVKVETPKANEDGKEEVDVASMQIHMPLEPSEAEVRLKSHKEEIAKLMTAVTIGNSVFFQGLTAVDEIMTNITYQLANEGKLPVKEDPPVKEEKEIEERTAPVVDFTCCWGAYTTYKQIPTKV